MMVELCEEGQSDSEFGESIFEPGSRMGLQPEETEDYWIRDEPSATWTRVRGGFRIIRKKVWAGLFRTDPNLEWPVYAMQG